jgi:probable F420-dependent oxidoreductase
VRDFRFGVQVLAVSGHDEWVSAARRVEDLGFSTLTVADHLVDGCISPFAALGVAAEATSTLRIGTLVLNNDLRHPAVVARETLALDSLSGGRVELGLGAGHGFPEYESAGIRFDDAATRVARLAEAVDVLDGLLRGHDVTFSGDHYQLIAHRAWPSATQRPGRRFSSAATGTDSWGWRRRARTPWGSRAPVERRRMASHTRQPVSRPRRSMNGLPSCAPRRDRETSNYTRSSST